MDGMTEPIDPHVLAPLVAHHRRFLEFLEPRVGSRVHAEEILQGSRALPDM